MKARTFAAAVPPAPARSLAVPPAVTSAGASLLRRQCACGKHTAGGAICDECARRKSALRRKAARQGAPHNATHDAQESTPDGIPAIVDEVLRGAGHSFDGPARQFMEARFGRDFSDVRLHTDGMAAQSARAVDALAYTVGSHIVFDTGRYAPATPVGATLLAHELTHVAQNAAGSVAASAATEIGAPGDAAEAEADRLANTIMSSSILASGSAAPIQVQQRPGAALHRLDTGQAVGLGIGLGIAGTVIGLGIAAAAGAFDKNNFTDDELRAYLKVLAGGKIEGHTDSDNKARALIRRLASGTAPFTVSVPEKALLIREMQDGRVSDDDRNGIVTLMEITPDAELAVLLAPGSVDFASVLSDIGQGEHGDRVVMLFVRRPGLHGGALFSGFLDWYTAAHFDGQQRPLAQRVVLDVLAIPALDFADATEFHNEVFKRVRISQMMTESQATENGFDYPENMDENSGCADYRPPTGTNKENMANARVNKAARAYWTDVQFDPSHLYYFDTTEEGRRNGYKALTTLFEPQQSICDKTLIHCDYLVSVIQFRAFAETMGEKKFNALVRDRTIVMRLTWNGFAPPPLHLLERSPRGLGYRIDVRPATRADFAIGDQVVFWNHLAFDGLNAAQQSPWRLENAVLIDKDASGDDLFQGHGSGAPEPERKLLTTLLDAYNSLVQPALDLTAAVDSGQTPQDELTKEYPLVSKPAGKWIVTDPGRQPARGGREYDLKLANASSPESEALLPGLRDPLDFSQLNPVARPAESQPGKLERPD